MNKSISELDVITDLNPGDLLLISQKTDKGFVSKKFEASAFKGESGLPAIEAFKNQQQQINIELQKALTAVTAGHKAFPTMADAQNNQSNIPPNTAVEIINDPDYQKNGVYIFDGLTLTKSPYDLLTQAKHFASNEIDLRSNDLFRYRTYLSFFANMAVERFLTDNTSTKYNAGTYQSQQSNSVNIAVKASGPNSTRHYFTTSLTNSKCFLEVNITKNNMSGDAVGIGYKSDNSYEIIALSNSGNLQKLTENGIVNLLTGLGTYKLGDKLLFVVSDGIVDIYVNDVRRVSSKLNLNGSLCIGQVGFSAYQSTIFESEIDPIRTFINQALIQQRTILAIENSTFTDTLIKNKSLDLFKSETNFNITNDLDVVRFVSDTSTTSYPKGTYQTLVPNGTQLNVTAAGSNSIKHYFISKSAETYFQIEFEVTKNNMTGDAIGVGFAQGANYNVVAYSNSGNLYVLSNYNSTIIKSGLGNYGLGDKVKFIVNDGKIDVFINGFYKGSQIIEALGNIIIGQMGFSQYKALASGLAVDPIRNYVIESTANLMLAKIYFQFYKTNQLFTVFVKIKNNIYVGFEIKHEVNLDELIYQDYWRIIQAKFYKYQDGYMQTTGKIALEQGESEFVFKKNANKDDFTGGYHGDEKLIDIKFIADGQILDITQDIALRDCNIFEYIENSTMHDTAENSIITNHNVIAYHLKHTRFDDGGYTTENKVTWNYDGELSTLYHGISCISKDVAKEVFSDSDYREQSMTGSLNNYFDAVGARLYRGRNIDNGLAVEATSFDSQNDDQALFFVHDRLSDSKYYRKSKPSSVNVGQLHHSGFKCRFYSI